MLRGVTEDYDAAVRYVARLAAATRADLIKALVRETVRGGYDLLAVGATPAGTVPCVGASATRLLREIPCPVLLVHARRRRRRPRVLVAVDTDPADSKAKSALTAKIVKTAAWFARSLVRRHDVLDAVLAEICNRVRHPPCRRVRHRSRRECPSRGTRGSWGTRERRSLQMPCRQPRGRGWLDTRPARLRSDSAPSLGHGQVRPSWRLHRSENVRVKLPRPGITAAAVLLTL